MRRALLFILLLGVAATVGEPPRPPPRRQVCQPFLALLLGRRPRTVVQPAAARPGHDGRLTTLELAPAPPCCALGLAGAIHFRWTPDGIITQGFLDLNGCRSLPTWPTGEGACSRRVFTMLLSSPWVLHDTAGRIVISLGEGFLLGVIALRCWRSSSTVPGPW